IGSSFSASSSVIGFAEEKETLSDARRAHRLCAKSDRCRRRGELLALALLLRLCRTQNFAPISLVASELHVEVLAARSDRVRDARPIELDVNVRVSREPVGLDVNRPFARARRRTDLHAVELGREVPLRDARLRRARTLEAPVRRVLHDLKL